ncbi:NIPSNAP family protein [Microbacterium album]|uniref:NIPSNAP family containing protein n=1 Tax=Microbacterium album TaxID=2053191 RepID=A0A917IDH2_9MICO|nr:NIPSNAP family protein [Microbacterium album]GGH33417.1 hypothetical protein GCM10010921_00330 [Microbacterium album]
MVVPEDRTVMLRRYRLADGTADEFVAWWRARILPLRAAAGFRVDWAYLDRENETFTWMVSYPGGRADFEAAEDTYSSSPERAAAIAVAPPLRDASVGYPERVV